MMTNYFTDAYDVNHWPALALLLAIQFSLLIACGLAIRCFCKNDSMWAYRIWCSVTMLSLLILPTQAVGFSWKVSIQRKEIADSIVHGDTETRLGDSTLVDARMTDFSGQPWDGPNQNTTWRAPTFLTATAMNDSTTIAEAPIGKYPSLSTIAGVVTLCCYAGGLIFFLARYLAGLLSLVSAVRSGRQLSDRSMEVFRVSANRLRLRRLPMICKSRSISGPLVFGLWEHCILVPMDFDEWAVGEKETVAMHELSHVVRRDCLLEHFVHAMQAVYWIHPFSHFLAQQIRMTRELATDRHVLSSGGLQPHRYAANLLSVVERIHAPFHAAGMYFAKPFVAMSAGADMKKRLVSILSQEVIPMSKFRSSLVVSALAFVGVACITQIKFVDANEQQSDPPNRTGPAESPVSLLSQTTSANSKTPQERIAAALPQSSTTAKQSPEQSAGGPVQTSPVSSKASETTQVVATHSQNQPDALIPQDFKITGQVTDESEKPIRGAKASLQFDRKKKSISVVTDEAGNFEIPYPAQSDGQAMPPRDLFLWVHASGYNLKCVRPQMEPEQFLPCQVILNEEDRINVLVHDANGEPCAEAIVEPYYFDVPNGVYYSEQSTGLVSIPPKDVAEALRVTTDEKGEAEFRGIPIRKFEGAYCNTQGMVPQLFRFKNNGNLFFELRPTGKIRGKVVCNETDIPNPDWTGRTVFVSSYDLRRADENNRFNRFAHDIFNRVQCHKQIEVDRDGRFELNGVLSGEVTVRLDMGDSELRPIPKQHETLEAEGELELQIEVANAVPVDGILLTEDTREPLAAVRISIQTTQRNALENSLVTTSDANGKFTCYLHPGDYTVHPFDISQSKQAKDYSYAPSARVSVKTGMDACKIPDLLFPRYERETGTLVDADGKALANRRVALIPMNSNHAIKYGTSDDQGKLDIRYEHRKVNLRQQSRWVIFPKNSKSVEGDVRQFPTLMVEAESPLKLMLSFRE